MGGIATFSVVFLGLDEYILSQLRDQDFWEVLVVLETLGWLAIIMKGGECMEV